MLTTNGLSGANGSSTWYSDMILGTTDSENPHPELETASVEALLAQVVIGSGQR